MTIKANTAIPNFADVPLCAAAGASPPSSRAAADSQTEKDLIWYTPEQIPVRPLYTVEDLKGVDHLDTMPGLPPFVRGPYATMYVQRPWTVRQYAGFSTAKDSNAFYR